MVDLSYFGLGATGTPDSIDAGRRRVVTYLAFLVFVFTVAASDANDWVRGGLENTFNALPPSSVADTGFGYAASCSGLPAPEMPLSGRALQLKATTQRYFHLGLNMVSIETTTTRSWSGDEIQQTCVFPAADYIKEINAAISQVNCTRSYRGNIFCGQKALPDSTLPATYGLLITGATFQCAAWLVMALLQTPWLYGKAWTFPLAGVGMGLSTFFSFAGVLNFAASPMKTTFCAGFDPDTEYGVGCGYSDGYGVAGTALAFGFLQSLLFWLWMPRRFPARYEFTGAGVAAGGGGGGASSKGGYTGIGGADSAAPFAPSGLSASAYQDIGTSA